MSELHRLRPSNLGDPRMTLILFSRAAFETVFKPCSRPSRLSFAKSILYPVTAHSGNNTTSQRARAASSIDLQIAEIFPASVGRNFICAAATRRIFADRTELFGVAIFLKPLDRVSQRLFGW